MSLHDKVDLQLDWIEQPLPSGKFLIYALLDSSRLFAVSIQQRYLDTGFRANGGYGTR